MDATHAYLDTLFREIPPDLLIELRWRTHGDAMRSEFAPVNQLGLIADRIRELAPVTDVYVGCAARRLPSGRREAVAASAVAWVDCDSATAAAAARDWNPRPTMVVASGSPGCLHAYWRLENPLSAQTIEQVNLRLATALGADTKCFDAGRILRPAGTLNHKTRPARSVGLDRLDRSLTVDTATLLTEAPEVGTEVLAGRWLPRAARNAGDDPLLRIPPPVYVAELLGRAPALNGKVQCPFHEDRRASLHVYNEAARGWCCFSCGRGGSIYDLAAALWGFNTRGRDFVLLRRQLRETFAIDRGISR